MAFVLSISLTINIVLGFQLSQKQVLGAGDKCDGKCVSPETVCIGNGMNMLGVEYTAYELKKLSDKIKKDGKDKFLYFIK